MSSLNTLLNKSTEDLKPCKTYKEALKHYTKLTQIWLDNVASGATLQADTIRQKRYFYLDEMNRLNPDKEADMIGGFIL